VLNVLLSGMLATQTALNRTYHTMSYLIHVVHIVDV